jgi:Fic family protein
MRSLLGNQVHPFLDGNGRLGRLLLLIDAGVLSQPLLYLSLCFRQHRPRYDELLAGLRHSRDWEASVDYFFQEGVESTASAAVATAQRLLELFRIDEARLVGLGRSGPSVRQGYAALRQRPLTSIRSSLKNRRGEPTQRRWSQRSPVAEWPVCAA